MPTSHFETYISGQMAQDNASEKVRFTNTSKGAILVFNEVASEHQRMLLAAEGILTGVGTGEDGKAVMYVHPDSMQRAMQPLEPMQISHEGKKINGLEPVKLSSLKAPPSNQERAAKRQLEVNPQEYVNGKPPGGMSPTALKLMDKYAVAIETPDGPKLAFTNLGPDAGDLEGYLKKRGVETAQMDGVDGFVVKPRSLETNPWMRYVAEDVGVIPAQAHAQAKPPAPEVERLMTDPKAMTRVTSPDGGRYMQVGARTGLGQGFHVFESETKPELTGWKLHVSATTPEAMEELAQLGMKHKVGKFKFAGDDTLQKHTDPNNPQSGKTAVFYHSENGVDGKPVDWKAFIAEADAIVEKHGGPGPGVQHDRAVPGAKAVYYRNDRGAQGEDYVARKDLTQYGQEHNIGESRLYNPSNAPDPFHKISIGGPDAPKFNVTEGFYGSKPGSQGYNTQLLAEVYEGRASSEQSMGIIGDNLKRNALGRDLKEQLGTAQSEITIEHNKGKSYVVERTNFVTVEHTGRDSNNSYVRATEIPKDAAGQAHLEQYLWEKGVLAPEVIRQPEAIKNGTQLDGSYRKGPIADFPELDGGKITQRPEFERSDTSKVNKSPVKQETLSLSDEGHAHAAAKAKEVAAKATPAASAAANVPKPSAPAAETPPPLPTQRTSAEPPPIPKQPPPLPSQRSGAKPPPLPLRRPGDPHAATGGDHEKSRNGESDIVNENVKVPPQTPQESLQAKKMTQAADTPAQPATEAAAVAAGAAEASTKTPSRFQTTGAKAVDAGGDAFGVYQGVKNFNARMENNDIGGAAIAAADAAVSGTSATVKVVEAFSKAGTQTETKIAEKIGQEVAKKAAVAAEGQIAKAGVKQVAKGMAKNLPVIKHAVIAADGAYNVYQADGLQAKVETGIKTGGALGGAVLGAQAGAAVGTIIGGPIGTAAGGFVGGVGGAIIGDEATAKTIEGTKYIAGKAQDATTAAVNEYSGANIMAAESKRFQSGELDKSIRPKDASDPNKPLMTDYKNLAAIRQRVAKQLPEGKIDGHDVRTEFNKIDMTKPENYMAYKGAINKEIAAQGKVMQENRGLLSYFGDRADKFNNAKSEMDILRAAEGDFAKYETRAIKYNEENKATAMAKAMQKAQGDATVAQGAKAGITGGTEHKEAEPVVPKHVASAEPQKSSGAAL